LPNRVPKARPKAADLERQRRELETCIAEAKRMIAASQALLAKIEERQGKRARAEPTRVPVSLAPAYDVPAADLGNEPN
jgi:hypothetical protein